MNSCTFFGRLVRDVEIRYSKNNVAVGRFSLAVNRAYQKGDKKTDFLNMTAFGKTAENIGNYFRQGSRIVVHCHAHQEEYEKDGTKINSVGFIVDGFSFVDTRAEGGITQNQNAQSAQPTQQSSLGDGWMNVPDGLEDDGLPFN